MPGPTIDADGFHAVGFDGYLADWDTKFRGIYGTDIDLSPDAPDGRFVRVLAQRDTNVEQLLEQIYRGRSPAGAAGAGLARMVQLNGITKKAAQFSTAPITLSGVPGTVVGINSMIADPLDPQLPPFKTAASYTLGDTALFSVVPVELAGTPATVIPAGALIGDPGDPALPSFKTTEDLTIGGSGTSGKVSGRAVCTVAGPIKVAAKRLTQILTPVGGSDSVTNTSAVSEQLGTVSGQAICSVAGPVNVAAGRLTKIQTIVGGWELVTNTSAAAPGRLVEDDFALRARRAQSTAMPSQSMLDGLYAALADLPGVDDVVVYENATDLVNSRGEPAHSVHVIIDGGIDVDIANAIRVKKSMGATPVGNVQVTVTDLQGNACEMAWDVPVDEIVYVTVSLNRTPTASEVASITDALVAYGREKSRIGHNVAWWELATPINNLNLTGDPGQPSVTALRLGSSPNPTQQVDLVVPFNARPRFFADNIRVVGP